MPHVNLIFPFVTPEQFPTAASLLSEALSGFEPFEVKFDSFKSFNHGSSSVIWLHPSVTLIDCPVLISSHPSRLFLFKRP
jgi:2'-5' RNA ligase